MNALDRSIQRLLLRFPPKHPDRSTMRPREAAKADALKGANQTPSVSTNGWQGRHREGQTVNWKKQESIPVGQLDGGLWAAPPPRGQHVSSGKGRGNKGPKNG